MRAIRSAPTLLLLLVFAACGIRSATYTKGTEETLTITFSDDDPKEVELDVQPDPGPVKLCFTDEDGNSVGEIQGNVPLTGSVPAGATDWEIKPADEEPDPEPDPGEEGQATGGIKKGKIRKVQSYLFAGGAVTPDLERGAFEYQFVVSASSRTRAFDVSDSILLALKQGTGLPVGVYDIAHASYTILVNELVVFYLADEGAFTRLDFELNGQTLSDIDDAVLGTLGNLHTATLTVPLDDFNWGVVLGASYRNDFVLKLTGVERGGYWEYTFAP